MYNNVMHEVCVPWAMLMLIKRKRKHYKQTERGENEDFSEEEEAQGVRLLQVTTHGAEKESVRLLRHFIIGALRI